MIDPHASPESATQAAPERIAATQPIADEGFPDFATLPARRGTWQDFVALMELVEQLCPEWPHREPLRGEIFRL